MAPFWMANSLVLITPALAGRNFLSDQRCEPRAARICGVPPALGSLWPASGWLVYGDMSSFFEPSGSLLHCHEWFPIAFPFTQRNSRINIQIYSINIDGYINEIFKNCKRMY